MIRLFLTLAATAASSAMFIGTATGAPTMPDHTASHAAMKPMTGKFAGTKVNAGFATYAVESGRRTLTLSEDFKIPDTPAPHWQVVDSKGNTYLLNRLMIKGDKVNRTITLPTYVADVAKVQIWCAYAEVLLGEASFDAPVM